MTSSRDAIFANIRRALGVKGSDRIRQQVVADRLERAPKGVIPARAQLQEAERVALFKTLCEGAAASVVSLARAEDAPAAVAAYLRDQNLPAAVRTGEDARLAGLPWGETALAISTGRSDGADLVSVSHAEAGIAETGTLVLTSGADNPSTLNFLPDHHIVVVSAKDVVSDLEGVWKKLRARHGKGEMPRTVNLITGPSRSGDIEQTILLGAHGPRRLHVLVVP